MGSRWYRDACSLSSVALMAACGSNPPRDQIDCGCDDRAAYLMSEARRDAGVRQAVFSAIAGEGARCATAVPPGRYGVMAKVRWSNGWVESVKLASDMLVEPGEHYAVLASERDGPQAAVYDVRTVGYTTPAARAALYVAAVPGHVLSALFLGVSAIVYGPVWLVHEAVKDAPAEPPKPRPTARPSEACCRVWVQRVSTGEMIAGEQSHGGH